MEKSNGCISKSINSKDYNNGGGRSTNKPIINCRISPTDIHALRETRAANHHESFGDGRDLVGEFSWPPRFYTCTFCKREFRSAQALGGHMNVHRREKARLRQTSPPNYLPFLPPPPQRFTYNSKSLDLKLDSNPNPNISTCPSSSAFSAPFRVSTSSDSANFLTTMRSQKSDLTVDHGNEELSHDKEYLIFKKSEKDSLVKSKFGDLDLELRLGLP